MEIIYNKIFLEHNMTDHPENSDRLRAFKNLKETKVENGEKHLELVHTKNYIEYVKKASEKESYLDSDTYTNKKTYETACYAVGAAILAAKTNNYALIRPPGHHAFPDRGSGFCIFNNIAIATKYLVNKGKKVAILDFDCHHGNGSQSIFYDTDKVLYLSTHLYPYYPGTGWINEIGEGKGKGYNINIPLPAYTGDDLFIEALNFFIPIIKNKFKPDFIAVSAGFDAHYSDPITQMNLSLNSYYTVGKLLSEFKNVFAVLEGGYNLEFLPKGVYSFINGINNDKIKYNDKKTKSNEETKGEYKKRINELKDYLSDYWF